VALVEELQIHRRERMSKRPRQKPVEEEEELFVENVHLGP
jgi:hypothetical protein